MCKDSYFSLNLILRLSYNSIQSLGFFDDLTLRLETLA